MRFLIVPLLLVCVLGPRSVGAEDAPRWTTAPTRVLRDRAPPERLPEAVVPSDERRLLHLRRPVRIDETGQILAGTRVLRLAGVTLVGRDRTCRRADGALWACGLKAAVTIANLLGGRTIACRPVSRDEGLACDLDGVSVAKRLVEEGWALPADGAPTELLAARDAAVAARRGIWSDPR